MPFFNRKTAGTAGNWAIWCTKRSSSSEIEVEGNCCDTRRVRSTDGSDGSKSVAAVPVRRRRSLLTLPSSASSSLLSPSSVVFLSAAAAAAAFSSFSRFFFSSLAAAFASLTFFFPRPSEPCPLLSSWPVLLQHKLSPVLQLLSSMIQILVQHI